MAARTRSERGMAERWYGQLAPRPSPDLDRVLDAVERCLVRFGLTRTSMTDVARELGVARTTLYRQVGSLDEAMALLQSRRFHRFLDELVVLTEDGVDAATFIDVLVRTVRSALADQVGQRVLQAEPELLGDYLTSGSLRATAAQVTALLTPVVATGMEAGRLRPGDPATTAGWIVRIVLAVGMVPPPEDELEPTLRAVLEPLLVAPGGPPPTAPARRRR